MDSENEGKPEWLTELQVLRLRPGDVIVLRTETMLSDSKYEHIKAIMKEKFPDHEVMILENGLNIGVIHQGGSNNE